MYPIWQFILFEQAEAHLRDSSIHLQNTNYPNMADKSKHIPPHLRHSLLALIIFLIFISVVKFYVTLHQQEERIEVLEAQVEQLLADTTRLRILPAYSPNRNTAQRSSNGKPYYHRNNYNQKRQSASASNQGSLQESSRPTDKAEDTKAEERQRKFTEAHLFDLNTVDSLNLIRIPGIAGRTASVIIKNRQRYGGFYNPWQLQEFLTWEAAKDYMEEWCTIWFTADASRIRPIPINAATISELQRHPYISHEQAVEIVRYRTRHKRIASAGELQQLTTFSDEQIQQLFPYLSFE